MPTAELVAGRLTVETAWNEKTEIKEVPGARWDTEAKLWHVPLTWTACLQLRGVFGDRLSIGPALAEWAWLARARVQELTELRAWLAPPADWAMAPAFGRYPFQVIGSAFLQRAQGSILADEMGTGKTVQAVGALRESGDVPVLVICPNSVKEHWARTVRDWSHHEPFVVGGSAPQRRKVLDAASKSAGAVVIVNYEAARTMTRLAGYGSTRLARCRECDPHGEELVKPTACEMHPRELNAFEWRAIILDEAHRIKDPHAKQTRAAWALCDTPTVRHRWLLTGTPLVNHPDDLWSLLRAASPKEFPTKTAFVDRYCLVDWNTWGGREVVGLRPDTKDEFYAVFDPHMRRVRKAEVLTQLPPKVREVRWVEMTPAQRKAYNQLQQTLTTVPEDGGPAIIAGNVMIARLRQMQFASSSVAVEYAPEISDWKVKLVEPSPKLDELELILDELGDKPVAVCAQSRQLIELAAARLTKLKITYGLITGAVPTGLRDHALAEFQAGKTRVLLFTIAAGGVGLTMTAADTIVFLQRSWSMVDNRQAEDRVHRIGSEAHDSVTVIDVVCRDSVEEGQVAKLHEKLLRLDEITRDRLTIDTEGNYTTTELDQEEEQIMSGDLAA